MASTTFDVVTRVILDEGSVADTQKAIADASRNMQRNLSRLKLDWKAVAQHSTTNIQQLERMSKEAATFGNRLKSASAQSIRHLTSMGDELSKLHDQMNDLNEMMEGASDDATRSNLEKQRSATVDKIKALNKQIDFHRDLYKKEGSELSKVIKAQQKYQQTVGKAASFSAKDMAGQMGKGLQGILGGNVKGGLGDILGGLFKGGAGKFARRAQAGASAAGGAGTAAGAAKIANAARALGVASAGIAAAAAGIMAFVKLIQMASDHMAKLNQTMLSGVGFVNDMGAGASAYTGVLDDLRNAAIDSAKSMLRFGKNSVDTMKILNAYTKEATGSLIKTRDTMVQMGEGSVTAGVEKFARSATVYGKALSMEGEEVAQMMGSFVSEIGYSADNVTDLMGDIVKSAATANIPMGKFMGIFRSVLPDVELYQNRLEELTGTIKLLSQTMSPKDVKNFMNAFAKGFKGMDFRQRLKTALITGVDFVSKTLSKDFDMKARSMAKNFARYGINSDEFVKAYKGGTKSMADLIAKAQGRASELGEKVSGTAISNAMKLAGYEGARKKGGALNVATAMRGAGTYATYQIIKKQSQAFTSGFDGLAEHVIKQTGITEQQYEALRNMRDTMATQRSTLERFGKTASASTNRALKSVIARDKGVKESQVTLDMMRKATEAQLFEAAEQTKDSKKTISAEENAEEMAVAQTNAVLSITDMLKNVIAFWLEKIFQVMDPVNSTLKDIAGIFMGGGKDNAEAIRDIRKETAQVLDVKQNASGMQTKIVGDAVVESLRAGKTDEDLASYVGQSGAFSKGQLLKAFGEKQPGIGGDITAGERLQRLGENAGLNRREAAEFGGDFIDSVKSGDIGKAIQLYADELDMSTQDAAMEISRLVEPSDAAKKMYADQKEIAAGRAAPADYKVYKTTKEVNESRAASDTADLEEVTDWNAEVTVKGAEGAESAAGPQQTAAGWNPVGYRQRELLGMWRTQPGSAGAGSAVTSQPAGAAAAGARADVHRSGAARLTTKADKTTLGEVLAALVNIGEYTKVTSEHAPDIEVIADNTFDIADGVDEVAKIAGDVLSEIKSGVDFSGGFVNGAYKNVLKDTTLDTFRTALLEFAIVYSKMWDDEEYRKQLVAGGQDFMGAGGTMADLVEHINKEAAFASAREAVKSRMDFGTSNVPSTGLYYLQKGEAVLSGDDVKRGRVGNVNASIVINGTSLSAGELQHAVEAAMHAVVRKN